MGAGILYAVLGSVISRIILSSGVSIVSFYGLNFLLSSVFDSAKGSLLGMPMLVLQMLGLMDVDIFLNLIFSAYAAVVAYVSLPRLAFGSTS